MSRGWAPRGRKGIQPASGSCMLPNRKNYQSGGGNRGRSLPLFKRTPKWLKPAETDRVDLPTASQ